MELIECRCDLFEVNSRLSEGKEPYCLAHCISADFGMFGGVVVGFNERWDMKNRLLEKYEDYQHVFRMKGGLALPEEVIDHDLTTTVYNLVNKPTVSSHPTYRSLEDSLNAMREHMWIHGHKRLAIPTIGCGIDGLEWDKVKDLIEQVFSNLDVEIKVCRKD